MKIDLMIGFDTAALPTRETVIVKTVHPSRVKREPNPRIFKALVCRRAVPR